MYIKSTPNHTKKSDFTQQQKLKKSEDFQNKILKYLLSYPESYSNLAKTDLIKLPRDVD